MKPQDIVSILYDWALQKTYFLKAVLCTTILFSWKEIWSVVMVTNTVKQLITQLMFNIHFHNIHISRLNNGNAYICLLYTAYSGYGKYLDPLKFFSLCYIAAIC